MTTPAGERRNGERRDTKADPTLLTTEQLHREVGTLRELIEEKFKSVTTQFELIERQRVEQKSDTEKAVQAALSAAKEALKEQTMAQDTAVAKSETATTKSIDQAAVTFSAAIEGLRREIGDLKERITAVQSEKRGGQQASAAIYAFAAFLVAILIITGIVFAFANPS